MQRLVPGLMFIAFAAMILALPTAAGEIHIPDNKPAAGGANSWPFNSHSEWRYHLLIPARMLGGKPFSVKELAVAPATPGSGTWTATQFQLRMAHTTRTSLSATFAVNLGSSPTVLHDGAISFGWKGGTWSTLGISGRFQYDGSSNLVLEVRYQGGPGSRGITVRTDVSLKRCYTHKGATSNPYAATTCITPVPGPLMGMKLRLTTVDTMIVGGGTGQNGSVVDLRLLAPSWPGEVYRVGSALGAGPTTIGSRSLGLRVDALLVVSARNLAPSIFRDYAGLLDAKGLAKASINIPKTRALVGVRLYSAFLVIKSGSPFGIADISDTFLFTIR